MKRRPTTLLCATVLLTCAGCRNLLGIRDLEPHDAEVEPPADPDAATTSRWRIVIDGDGAGRLDVAGAGLPPGLSCPPRCEGDLASGQELLLTPHPEPGSHLAELTPDDGRARLPANQARIYIFGETEVRVRFLRLRHNLIFISSRTVSTDLGGVAAYDEVCRQLADDAELPTDDFIALLPSSTESWQVRLGAARGFVGLDGRPVADLLQELVLQNPILLTEHARLVAPDLLVFTGLDRAGRVTGSCQDWTSTNPSERIGVGVTWSGSPLALADGIASCGDQRPIYCAMRRSSTLMATVPHPGRLVFVSRGEADTAGGAAAADALCQSERPASRSGATFRALLARPGVLAAQALELAASYVRPDGQLLGTGFELTGGRLRTGIWQFADGELVPWRTPVLTGSGTSPETAGLPDETCLDWSSTTANVVIGRPISVHWWWSYSSTGCGPSGAFHLYCVEQ